MVGAIPDSLCNLVNLRTLFLDTNAYSGPLPAQLGNLVHLESMYAHA